MDKLAELAHKVKVAILIAFGLGAVASCGGGRSHVEVDCHDQGGGAALTSDDAGLEE